MSTLLTNKRGAGRPSLPGPGSVPPREAAERDAQSAMWQNRLGHGGKLLAEQALIIDQDSTHRDGGTAAEPAPMFDLIELLFFAYRDFVRDADRLLEAYGFGRAHHRVLHFVHRHPGLTVAELLDILKITKQSLNRVMKDLLDGDFVEARAGVSDRRRRLLFPTGKGRRLALDLAHLQSERFRRTLGDLPSTARAHAVDFLLGMIDAGERAKVMELVWSGTEPGRAATRRGAMTTAFERRAAASGRRCGPSAAGR